MLTIEEKTAIVMARGKRAAQLREQGLLPPPTRDAQGKIMIERSSNPHLDLPKYDTETGAE